MNLTDFINQTDKLPSEQKGAILQIIDLKTSEDMKEVIFKLDQIRHDTEKSINRLSNLLFWLLGVIGAGIVMGITIFLTYLQNK